jgi:effector-binding domain-containing protein
MRSLKYVILLLLILIIGGSIYIATLENNFDIKQTKTIEAPAEVIFNSINEYKTWKEWGPWYETDSTIVVSYPEITSGVGATYMWTGIEGVGSMKTISLVTNEELIQQIDFGTGSTPEIYWKLNTVDSGTEVTWGMRGKHSFKEKIYWLYKGGMEQDMDPMFKKGLELLEVHILKEMDKHSFEFKGVVDYGGGFYLYQTTACKIDLVNQKLNVMIDSITKFMADNTLEPSGKPFMLSHEWDEVNNTTMFSACIPVNERIITTGEVLTGFLEPQKTFKTVFKGNYKFSYEAWAAANKALTEQGYTEVDSGEPFEVYKIRPIDTPNPANWVTDIYIPIN